MDLITAIRSVPESGGSIRRESWPKELSLTWGFGTFSLITRTYAGVSSTVWEPSVVSILASDWELVERGAPKEVE